MKKKKNQQNQNKRPQKTLTRLMSNLAEFQTEKIYIDAFFNTTKDDWRTITQYEFERMKEGFHARQRRIEHLLNMTTKQIQNVKLQTQNN